MYQGNRETPWAIILAGGRATRLGPLTAQMNKALVSVGQRPILAYQLEALRRVDVQDVVIVVSPGQLEQVEDFVYRSHAGLSMNIKTVVQAKPQGPAHAVSVGLDYGSGGPMYVLMADTFFDADELYDAGREDWIGVEFPPTKRAWCWWNPVHQEWVDGVTESHEVAVGLYHFTDVQRLYDAYMDADFTNRQEGQELGMAPLLNAYGDLRREPIHSWQDVGDVKALAHARRHNFLSRSFNKLTLDTFGRVHKLVGESERDEIQVMMQRPGQPSIWPEVYKTTPDTVIMEYVDLPTLAELYLFWPGRPDMWAWILQDLHARMNTCLWQYPPDVSYAIGERAEAMYVKKLSQRFVQWDHPIKKHEVLRINGETWKAGVPLIDEFHGWLRKNVIEHAEPATLHGDLNFSNILYSLGTGTFKLVDPRGRWGGIGCYGDIRYEIAKLRYSYADHFTSITHGLFECSHDEEEVRLKFGPQRGEETRAMDLVLDQLGYNLKAIKAVEATIFLSSMPLHDEHEQVPLYCQGVRLANQVMAW